MDSTVLTALAVFVVAGIVKGVVGLGLPTVAMALLALDRSPAAAAALLIVPSLVTNVWQMRPWSGVPPLLRRLAPMQVAVVLATLAGAWWFGAPAGAWARMSLGLALVAYAGWAFLAGPSREGQARWPPAAERWLGVAAGAATGLVTAATGVFVIPAVPYLQSLGLGRTALLQAMGLSFTSSTLALALGLAGNRPALGVELAASLAMLAPALVGMGIGAVIRDRLSAGVFRRCFFISLAVLGLHMVAREAWLMR